MKSILVLLGFLFSGTVIAADNPLSCSGANCNVILETRDGAGVKQTTVSADGATNTVILTNPLPVSSGGSGITSGTSGGIPYFSSTSALLSSGQLTANRIVLGGGAGTAPTVLGSLGTTTTVLHGNAAGAPSFGAVTSSDITDGTITAADIGTDAVGASEIAADAIGASELANDSVASANIINGSIVAADINASGDIPHTCTIRTATSSASATVSKSCNAGEIVTGGGCQPNVGTEHLIMSYPSAANQWQCRWDTSATGHVVHAICCVY